MITYEQVAEFLGKFADLVYCDGNHNPTYVDKNGISISVILSENEFRLKYQPNYSTFILDSGSMSPLLSTVAGTEHFDKMYAKFIEMVMKLK